MANNEILVRSSKKQALAFLQSNRPGEAKSLLDKICQLDNNDIESWILLAQIHARLGQPEQVERCCREIIRINPGSPDAYYHLGCALMFQNKRAEAIEAFRRLLQLNPGHALAHLHMGNLSANLGEALPHYQRAVQLQPNLAEAHGAIGNAQMARGEIEEAISSFRQALRIAPETLGAQSHSGLLFVLNYSSAYDARTIFSEHLLWGEAHGLPELPSHANAPDPDRRLRVGYVSPDLREHSVAYFFEPLLANHSAEAFETFCYAEVAQPDAITRRLQSIGGHWCTTCGMSDGGLVERIRADGIDILVDLAGHSSNNRLAMFSARPAPVQITYLGYPNTTGLRAMDYRLTDVWADPPGQAGSYYTESLVRLPRGFLCYLPPSSAPAVTPPPAMTRGHVTFGSFNNLPKVTPAVVSLWASILHAVPNARLVVKNFSLSDPASRERYFQLFADQRIDPSRLDFRGRHDSLAEHLGSYGEIDIALDTFPYNGATTTCEALWMGVPVITLAGSAHAGRVGVSLLNQVGLTELIAESPESYVDIACGLAKNPERLVPLRAALREQLAHSSLCDGKNFARDVESAYRAMWRKWCAGRQS